LVKLLSARDQTLSLAASTAQNCVGGIGYRIPNIWLGALLMVTASAATNPPDPFVQTVRPILAANCGTCHNPVNSENPANFLTAQTAKDIEAKRGLWRNVAAQLRNRSMPPIATKLTEEERLLVANWVDNRLRQTACNIGEFAGASAIRRLNRRDYHNTIRDLLGVDFPVASLLPADGTGGAGFDTNGETLYTGPLMMERYLEAAQQIVDHAIISAPLEKAFPAATLSPPKTDGNSTRAVSAGEELSITLPTYVDGTYEVHVTVERTDSLPKLELKVDGVTAGPLEIPQRGFFPRRQAGGRPAPVPASITVHLEHGMRALSIVATTPATVSELTVNQKPEEISWERRALHVRLLGSEPGTEPLEPRKAAGRILTSLVHKAYRRPIKPGEVDRYLLLYDRSAQRGDPYEERMKLAIRGILVSTDFLFRVEDRKEKPGIYPIGQYEMASRLSYFLWSTMPDEELFRLAEQGKLQDPKVLAEQVDRMLDDPRSSAFTTSFIGQWLGTQDLGGRVVPLINTMAAFYNAESAADLRQEPVMLFNRILGENRSLMELLTADYTYLTARLVKFYQLEGQVEVKGNNFQLVKWPDNRRAGVLGMAAPLAITSQLYQTSPVLRGAWVLETLLGTPVPPPPPNVPPLPQAEKTESEPTMREKLMQHRANTTCATCHRLMDPIGFGLENFDGLGRWRDKDAQGRPIDSSGELPSGEKFNGPVELRQALMAKKADFLRHLTGKLLGYALGRSLQDGDSCTVQQLTDRVEKDGYRARTMIREIVLSTPFRNTQGGIVNEVVAKPVNKLPDRIVPCHIDGSCAPLKPPEDKKPPIGDSKQ
jgi:hypothetical protein